MARVFPGAGTLRLAALLLAVALLPAQAQADAEGRNDAPTDRVQDAMVRLASPLEGERRRGSERLAKLLGGEQRTRIVQSLLKASEAVQQELVSILAADAGSDAIQALMQHLTRVTPEQANRVMLALARTPAVVQYLGPKLAKDEASFGLLAYPDKKQPPQAVQKRLDVLKQLVRRAEIESLLVSRKSPSGGTGYYQGQYDVIVQFGHREMAVGICLGIALDEALEIPGVFTSGVYDFLYPHEVDISELRGMAINAVSELATREDADVIKRLDDKFAERWRYILRRRAQLSSEAEQSNRTLETKEFQDAVFELGGDVAEMSDYLLCLYLINADTYTETLDDFLDDLAYGWRYPVRPQHVDGMIPGVLIRARRYSDAVDAYNRELRSWTSSRSFVYYNLACAYASWSRDPGDESPARLKFLATNALRRSFGAGWRDLGWMEEDRDLDPIRDTAAYKKVVNDIKIDLDLK